MYELQGVKCGEYSNKDKNISLSFFSFPLQLNAENVSTPTWPVRGFVVNVCAVEPSLVYIFIYLFFRATIHRQQSIADTSDIINSHLTY